MFRQQNCVPSVFKAQLSHCSFPVPLPSPSFPHEISAYTTSALVSTPQGWAALQTLGKTHVAHGLFDHAAGERSTNWLQWEEAGSLILVIRGNALQPRKPDEVPAVISLLYLVIQK